jgi:hypothetical protein
MDPAAALRGLTNALRPAAAGGRGGGGRARLVEAREGGQRQVDLAAHLHHRRRPRATQAQRQRADGAQVGGDVLPHLAVAARSADREEAVAVGERDGETVDLGLDHVPQRDVVVSPALEKAPVALVPRQQLVPVAGVGQREHRLQVAHLLELLQGRGADALGRRVGSPQVRVLSLERLQLAVERVVLGVVDLRLVEDVVEIGVMVEDLAKLRGSRDDPVCVVHASPFRADAAPGVRRPRRR